VGRARTNRAEKLGLLLILSSTVVRMTNILLLSQIISSSVGKIGAYRKRVVRLDVARLPTSLNSFKLARIKYFKKISRQK
jgi:hypothetical protein